MRERVGEFEFDQMAGSFFQNNNSILPSLIEYTAEAVKSSRAHAGGDKTADEKRYLVDAYCGSGLFAISLSPHFHEVKGIEIDKASVKWARQNAELNKAKALGKVEFQDGQAEAIFEVRRRQRVRPEPSC